MEPGQADYSCLTHTHTHTHAPVVTEVPAHTAGHPGPESTSPAASRLPRRGGGCFPAGTMGERMQRGGCEEAQTQRGWEREGGGRWTEGAGRGSHGSECRRPPGSRGASVDGPRAAAHLPPPGPGAPRPHRAADCAATGRSGRPAQRPPVCSIHAEHHGRPLSMAETKTTAFPTSG